jgi:hypothetical protein
MKRNEQRRNKVKKLLFHTATMALCSTFAFAAQQTITGQISDSMCKSNHAMMQKGATKMSEKDCTAACVKAGQKYVLVTKDKVYQIANQNYAELAANAGGSVTVTGDVNADGTSINIAKMNPTKP